MSRPDPGEIDLEPIRTELGNAHARIGVLEAILAELFVNFAALYDRPEAVIRKVMTPIGDELNTHRNATRENGTDAEKNCAENTLAWFEDLSGRLFLALSPDASEN